MKHKRPSSVLVLDSDVSEFRLILERYAGVMLDQPCETLRALLSQYSEMHDFKLATDLLDRLRSSPAQCETVLESLLAGDSDFFRHSGAFAAFQEEALPAIVEKKAGLAPSPLRIWSAGCGTGEEAYSIALLVCEALKDSRTSWNLHIVASDIRRGALKVAERGLYSESKLGKVPEQWISSYFSRVGDHFLVKPRLRNLITFSAMNLAQDNFFGHFDCVFCMDVLPHFSANQRSALLQRLAMFLEPGGYLFLGDSEKLSGDPGLECSKHVNYKYYRRLLASAARGGR